MAIPLSIQLFDAYLGTQESIHALILPDIFSSGGSKNLFIDKYGRAKKISGYSKQNASAVTTDTGASATRLRGLFPYKATAGGTTTRQLIGVFDDGVDEFEIWTSANSGATWTFRADLGASPVGQIPDFAQFGDILYICTGKVVPKQWNGSAVATVGSTQSPTPAGAAGSAGGLSGNLSWKLVSIIATSGARKYGSVASANLAIQDKQATVTWTADTDVLVGGYELYRTTGTGDVYYFVAYVDGRTTATYTDNIPDLTILQNRVLEEHGDPPPTAYFCTPHKQRIWWLRSDTYPTRGWFSDAGLPDSVLTSFNYLEFSDSETVGDVITGAVGNYEGQLIVFTERAIWAVSGTGQVIGNILDWTRIRTNAQVGSVSHHTAVRIPAGSKYTDQNGQTRLTPVVTLAYWTPLGDIRLFDGDNDIIISSPVKTTMSGWNYAQRTKVFAVHDTARSEVTWSFASGGAGENNTAVTWNYRWGVWYQRDWPFACAVEADETNTAQVLLAGEPNTSKGGFCYKLWSGNSFDGTAISAQWMTKTLYGINERGQPALSSVKRWRWADFLFETEQNVTLTVEWMPGNTPDNAAAYGSTTILPSASMILTAGGDTIDDAVSEDLSVSASSSLRRALLHGSTGRLLHDEGLRLRIGDNASSGSWSLEGMNLAYQLMPGMQRRMQG